MAMDGNAAGGLPRFSVRTVITASLVVLRANIWRFIAIILGVGVPAALVLGIVAALVVRSSLSSGGSPQAALQSVGGAQALLLFLVFVLAMLAYLLILCALTFGTLQSLNGRKAGIGESLSNGFAALPRAFLAGLVFALATVIVGFVINLVVPAGGTAVRALAMCLMFALFVFVVVVFWVFLPAVVAERAGPIACFKRSLALTKGHRWAVLGILALVFAANWIVQLLTLLLAQIGAPAASGVLNFAAGLFFLALSAVLATVGYFLLRAEKDGVTPDSVVKVFD